MEYLNSLVTSLDYPLNILDIEFPFKLIMIFISIACPLVCDIDGY